MTHEFDDKKYEKAPAAQREWGAKLIAELGLRGAERRAFRNVVVTRMIEETKQDDGRRFETFRRFNVYGVK